MSPLIFSLSPETKLRCGLQSTNARHGLRDSLCRPHSTPGGRRLTKVSSLYVLAKQVGELRCNRCVRHEVASITIRFALARPDPLCHQRFLTGTCVVGNDGVRSCRDTVASAHGAGQPPARDVGDWQPHAGRELRMDRLVKTPELLYTRRHCRNSASGCHAVTKRYVIRDRGDTFLCRGRLITGVKAEPQRSRDGRRTW